MNRIGMTRRLLTYAGTPPREECCPCGGVNLSDQQRESSLSFVVDIVASYVSMNHVQPSHLPELIATVHEAIARLHAPEASPKIEQPREPAVPIKKSITRDFIVCLEDGKTFRSLRRHLMSSYGMTPEAYREKWKLPKDYPMVAPAYAAIRSRLAKAIGLGSGSKKADMGVEPVRTEAVAARPEKARAAKANTLRDVGETSVAASQTEPDATGTAAKTPKKTRGRPRKDSQPSQKAA